MIYLSFIKFNFNFSIDTLISVSLFLKILDHLVRLLVCDHAFVSAFHFVEEDDIDVGLCALTEACRDHKSIEEIIIVVD